MLTIIFGDVENSIYNTNVSKNNSDYLKKACKYGQITG